MLNWKFQGSLLYQKEGGKGWVEACVKPDKELQNWSGSAGRSEIHICSAFFGETIKEAI